MSQRKPKSKQDTWQNIEYWIKRYPDKSIAECEEMLKEKLINRKSNNPLYLKYWIKRYPDKSIAECEEMLRIHKKESSWQNIEYWIKRYPDKSIAECEEMMELKKKSSIKKRPDTTGVNNPAHKSKTTEHQRKERSIMCIEYWRKKFPDEPENILIQKMNEKKQEVIQKIKDTPQTHQLRYWITKGYTKEEAQHMVSNIQKKRAFTLEHCIQKYGDIKGLEIFRKRQEKWQNSLHNSFLKNGDNRSTQSKFARNIIHALCDALNVNVPEKEKYITDKKSGRNYAFDFHYKKKLIEFNGDYWHCNPAIYKPDYWNKVKQMFASEIWEYDKYKKSCAEARGYKLLIVWESEFNENPDATINKCISFLSHD